MQRLLKFIAIITFAGTVIAINPCVAAGSESKAPSASAEVKTPQAVGKTAQPAENLDFIAQLEAAEKKPKETNEPSTPMVAVRFIVSLVVVLGLCYATMLGLKKFSAMKTVTGSVARGQIKVVEHSNLGANRTLHLVEIGSKRLLVASTPNQVNLLAELEAEELPESAPQQPSQGFKEQLSQFLGNKTDTTTSANTVAQMLRDSNSHIQEKVREVGSFRGRLRNVRIT